MNYVNFHWGDWVRSTQDLTPLEKGVYIDLLQRYYQKERPLTDEECNRIARAYANAEQEAMQYVLQTFFKKDAAGYRHTRCDEEIAKANAVSEKRANAAKKSWASRQGSKNPAPDANAMRTQSKSTANAEQVQSICNATPILQYPNTPIDKNPLTPLQGEGEAVTATAEGDEKPKRKRVAAVPRPEDVSEEVWEDFKTLRKAKRAPITATAISGLRKEAEKAGLTLEGALRVCIKNGWQGFEASWVAKDDRSEYLPNSRFKRQECRNYDLPI